MSDLATAYVQIIPTTKGIGSAIAEELGEGAEEAGKGVGSKIANGFKTAGKVMGAATLAGGAAIAGLTKSAVESYAEYEQLVGGIETLFGAQGMSIEEYASSVGKSTSEVSSEYAALHAAQDEVFANAAAAYKTAGISANEYMENVTSFSASLISSLDGDTQKAAKYADMAIVDMSDNANKMGSSIESIQNAYQGFAKQNYTMLDNLKLGYGGTKEEMQRLLDDASKLASQKFGVNIDYDINSYSDIIDAIHMIQDNMGITGTTAKEASETISGSVGMMKASWQNLVTGVADGNADLDSLIDNFLTSVGAVGENILPIAEKALDGVVQLVLKLAPRIIDKIPELVELLLPSLITGAFDLAEGVAKKIPDIMESLIDAVMDAVDQIGDKLAEKIPAFSAVFENLETVVMAVVGAFVAYKAALLIQSLINGVKNVMTALKAATEGQTIAQALLNKVMSMNPFVLVATVIGAVVAALVTLWNTNEDFRNAVKMIWGEITQFFTKAWETIKGVWSVVSGFFKAIWDNIQLSADAVVNAVAGFFISAWEKIKVVWDVVSGFFQIIWDAIKGAAEIVTGAISGFFLAAWDAITLVWGTVTGWFGDIWKGIQDVFSPVAEVLSKFFQDAIDKIKQIFDKLVGFAQECWDSIKNIFSTDIGDDLLRKYDNLKSRAAGMSAGGSANKSGSGYHQYATGGILRKGEIGLLEGTGAEAVVPLDQNEKWIHAVAEDFLAETSSLSRAVMSSPSVSSAPAYQGIGVGDSVLAAAGFGGDIIIPVSIGGRQIERIVIDAEKLHDLRTGGR